MSQLSVLSSNRVEILYEALKLELFRKTISPFPRRIIVVPSPAMKTWLLLKLASDPAFNIATGIEICFIDHALESMRRSFLTSHDDLVPNEMELSLLFEAFITKKIMRGYSKLSWDEREIWNPLLHYLKASDSIEHSVKIQSRMTALCSRLARLFLKYGQYGCRMLASWENSYASKCWQEQLWKEIKKLHPRVCFSYQRLPKMLEEIKSNPITVNNIQLHIFGLSFIPGQVHQFLTEAACLFPVNYYLLSPCQAFWSDICSDKEKIKLQKFWEKKGISKPQQQALELFLRERNGLLANFGRMGREMAIQIETTTHQIADYYQLPDTLLQSPCYAEELPPDIFFKTEERPLNLLQAVQSDMVLLRDPTQVDKLPLEWDDRSIQIHVAYTKYREVEILYNTLLHLLTTHANDENTITPSDIIVMAPNLIEYESVIYSIFGAKNSQLDFQMMEMQQLTKSSLLQGYLHLLSLASGRWEAESILQMLEYPEFQDKFGFSFTDIQQIRKWIQESGALWGQDISHRNILLKSDHGDCELMDESPTGTWEYSLKRLLMALAVEHSGLNDDVHAFIPPIEKMETAQIELLAKWLSLLGSLQRDLKPIADRAKMDLVQWTSYLESLKEKYFRTDSFNKEDVKYAVLLSAHLQALSTASIFVKTDLFYFDSIFFQLEKALKNEASHYRETHLQGVRFCSLLPMRALPAKIVVLLGMEEGAFPRKEMPFSLNELMNHPTQTDYFPSQTDFDRYLFLEALLSARRYFILSYVGYCFEGPRDAAPSLLVQELMNYLDSGYLLGNKKPSEVCTHRHPFDAFDQSYFSEHSKFPCYIPEHFLLAKAYYRKNKTKPHRFIPEFSAASQSIEQKEILTIKELAAFATNPLKVYFNQSLNMYLDVSDHNKIQSQEAFALTGLERYQLRMEGIKMPVLNLLEKASQRGKLPRGFFKQLSSEEITEEIEKMHLNFSQNNIEPQKIRPLNFSEHCEKAFFEEDLGWTLPPLKLNHARFPTGIKIIGTLKEVCEQGLIYHQKRDLVSILKVWPQYLILCLAIQHYSLPIAPKLISSKDAKVFTFPLEEIEEQFSRYLDYYFLGMKRPSPMIPEWIPDLLKGDPENFAKSMQSSLEGSFSSLYNEYALWLFRDRQSLPTSDELYRHWQPVSEAIFSALAEKIASKE